MPDPNDTAIEKYLDGRFAVWAEPGPHGFTGKTESIGDWMPEGDRLSGSAWTPGLTEAEALAAARGKADELAGSAWANHGVPPANRHNPQGFTRPGLK